MPMLTRFRLPDVGEGLTEAEIVTWHVGVGDVVEVNDVLVDIETAKSVVELPSPVAGTVTVLHAEVGTTIDVGTVIVTISASAADPAAGEAPATLGEAMDSEVASLSPVADAPAAAPAALAEDKPLVLVGTGPSAPADRRRRLGPRQPGGPASAPAPAPAVSEIAAVPAPAPGLTEFPAAPTSPDTTRARAKPPVRMLARQLGVDLEALVTPTEGIITREDVRAAVDAASDAPGIASAVTVAGPPEPRETRTPVKGVRKVTAAAVTSSAFSAPHVTEWLTVDVTPTMELIARLKADRAWAGVRVNPMLMVARAFLLAVRKHPGINARWEEDAQEIVQHHYVNLGIAAATPRGLIVPNIKDAHALDLGGLAAALTALVETARSGRTSPEQMARGTITITNIGALGVDAGTPILNLGEAAILAFGSIRLMPWVVDGDIVPRHVTQLAMSFDHRLVDGELGSFVLAETAALLADPGRAMTYV